MKFLHSDKSYVQSSPDDFLLFKTIETYGTRQMHSYSSHFTDKPMDEVMDLIIKGMDSTAIEWTALGIYTMLVLVDNQTNSTYYIKIYVGSHSNDKKSNDATLGLYLYCNFDDYSSLSNRMKKLELGSAGRPPEIAWVTETKNGLVSTDLRAAKFKPARDHFYPSIKEGVVEYLNRYDESESPILIILGPPGMGKTTLLTNYIYNNKKSAVVSYDDNLMYKDDFFLFFLNNEYDLAILEDMDLFLQAREDTDNKVMNKFLNLSQGVLDIRKKKLIFTANIEKHKIDPALIRPGRCFDILECDLYTESQAKKIIEMENLTFDGDCNNVSLAELFHHKKSKKNKGLGFV